MTVWITPFKPLTVCKICTRRTVNQIRLGLNEDKVVLLLHSFTRQSILYLRSTIDTNSTIYIHFSCPISIFLISLTRNMLRWKRRKQLWKKSVSDSVIDSFLWLLPIVCRFIIIKMVFSKLTMYFIDYVIDLSFH